MEVFWGLRAASLGCPAGNTPPSSIPRIIWLLVVKETADNFQFAGLPLELYRDILETPYSFLLPSQGTWRISPGLGGRAWERERGADQGCGWRERQAVSLGPGILHGPPVPGELPWPCPDRYLLGPDKAEFSNQALSHENLSSSRDSRHSGSPIAS